MPRFMLEGPWPCTIFCFYEHTLCMNYIRNAFLLVKSTVRSKQLLCFLHGQGQKSEQKPTTKNFVWFHNYSFLLIVHIDGCVFDTQNSKPKSTDVQAPIPTTENSNDKPKTPPKKSISLTSVTSSMEICRICHCEAEPDQPLISPCLCAGSLQYVHQSCLQRWIKSSDTKKCELCKYEFRMESKMKPITKVCWMNGLSLSYT